MVPELVLLFAMGEAVDRPSCVTAARLVEQVIAGKREELKGHEYCKHRIYDDSGDLDGDGVNDFVVVFTIEGMGGGGNDSIQFLALFGSASGWKASVKEVGRRGQRLIESVETTTGEIRLGTLEYGTSDPMCCPTRKGQLRLRLKNGILLPIQR